MTIKQKIEISDFLKGILKKIETTNNPNYNISCPVFIFDSEEKESFLIKIIADLEKEIYEEEENDNKTK